MNCRDRLFIYYICFLRVYFFTVHIYLLGYKKKMISGPILISALNILEGFNLTSTKKTDLNVHRMIESFKYGFAQRSFLGDPAFVSIYVSKPEVFTRKCRILF